jgi:hypothetical protein
MVEGSYCAMKNVGNTIVHLCSLSDSRFVVLHNK